MKIKKVLYFITIFISLSAFIPALTVLAADETIRNAEITAELSRDGSAYITQVLDIENLNTGTEYYFYIMKRENLHISSLEVTDETGQAYELLETWDVDRSLEEKAYTCGILDTDDRYELCWGLGSYGNHTYTIRYKAEGFVQMYEDDAGFYYQFLSSEQAAGMEAVKITVSMDGTQFSLDNARIWAIGFDSYIDFDEIGNIYAYNEDTIDKEQNIRIMCGFHADLFPDASGASGTFEDVKEQGLNGKNPEDEKFDVKSFLIVAGAIIALIAAFVIGAYVLDSKIKLADGIKQKRPKWKTSEPKSSLPFNGDIPAAYYALGAIRHSRKVGRLFAAYLMKWENDGVLWIEERENGKKKKHNMVMIFSDVMPAYPKTELKLFQMIRKRADENGELNQKTLQKWADKNYKKIADWETDLVLDAEHHLNNNNYIKAVAKKKFRYTQKGYEQLAVLQGLYRYLKEYKQHYAAGEIHTELWGNYLVYAMLMGVNEQIVTDLGESDQQYFDEFSYRYGHGSCNLTSLFIMTHLMSQSTVVHAQNISTSDGGGGSSSISGGGGFTGGGGGVR